VRSYDELRTLAGSDAVQDRVTEACDATLTLLVVYLALRGLGRGGHVALVSGEDCSAHPPRDIPTTNIMEGTRKRSITGPSHPHSPECMEGLFRELRPEGVFGKARMFSAF
jgi:hypothetical protein